jgi:hypothetical protein
MKGLRRNKSSIGVTEAGIKIIENRLLRLQLAMTIS